MSGEIERYTFEDAEGAEQTFTTFDAREAEETARRNGWSVIAHTYEWSDSEPVTQWDFAGRYHDQEPDESEEDSDA